MSMDEKNDNNTLNEIEESFDDERLSDSDLESLISDADMMDEDDVEEKAESETEQPVTPVQQPQQQMTAAPPQAARRREGEINTKNMSLLLDIYLQVTVELGRKNILVKDVLGLGEGSIIELDKPATEPVELLVNNRLVARGEVVVIDENFGVRVTEIVNLKEGIFKNL